MAIEKTEPPPFELTELDRQTLLITDEEFVPDDWEAVKEIINSNRLMDFRRWPSHLKRYITWTLEIREKYGSIINYICQKRLLWTPRPADQPGSTFEYKNAIPFADPDDYKILYNDWPYGMSPGIVHLVVWSKTPIATEPETGALIPESRDLIEKFVQRKFIKPLADRGHGADSLLWFRNWTKLQSVRAVEHFHVLVRGADADLLREWTNDDKRDFSVMEG